MPSTQEEGVAEAFRQILSRGGFRKTISEIATLAQDFGRESGKYRPVRTNSA
jgi:hypothetical protein